MARPMHFVRPAATIMVVLALMMTAVLTGAVGPEREAKAATTPCGVTAYQPSKSGSLAIGRGNMSCAYTGRTAAHITVNIEEHVGFVWRIRNSLVHTLSGNGGTRSTSASCQNHGTDNWRSYAKGTDTNGDTREHWSRHISITC